MANKWSVEELEAAVFVYLKMHRNDFSQIKYSKKAFYRELSKKFGRTEKSYEYRMQNISHVFALMGREWVKGLKPMENVGTNVVAVIEKAIKKIEN